MAEPTTSLTVSRRAVLTGTAIGLAGLIVPISALNASPARAAAAFTLTAPGIRVEAAADGTLSFMEEGGSERIRITHVMVKDSALGQQRTYGATVTEITLPDGRPGVRLAYRMAAAAAAITVVGTVDVTARRANLRWEVTGPATLLPSGFMINRTLVGNTDDEHYTPLNRWTRPAAGIPFEVADGGVYQETFAATRAYLGLEQTDPRYTSASWVHAPGTLDAAGTAVTTASLVLADVRPGAARTIAAARPTGVELWTDQPFNIWDDGAAPLTVHTQACNGTTAASSVAITLTARDFEGRTLTSTTQSFTVDPGGVVDADFAVPLASGIAFVEAVAASAQGSSFARTTLAVLPPFTYLAGAESVFGIANYPWLHVPSAADLVALMQRIGVRRVRIAYEPGNAMGYTEGMDPAVLDAAGIDHNTQLGRIPIDGTPAEGQAWAATNVASAIASGAQWFEVGNEVNSPWMQGLKAAEYVAQGLRPAVDALTAAGSDMKVLNAGTGGMDVVWLRNFIDAGGWDLIDGLAIHPGRGNFTPDFAPPLEDWDPGANGLYWNFLGSVQEAKRLIAEQGGGKELWLTEAYACTKPNSWWHDTHRHAAENVVLTFALALSEGVSGVNWYQLHDTTVHHPQEADPANPEFHYGLMNRDTSPKASLLAYATAARQFDRTSFLRRLEFADADLRGLSFAGEGGDHLAVLWSRKDGYVLNADHGAGSDYASPEPWIDTWQTKTPVRLAATGQEVRVIDVIGQERSIPVEQGHVTLVLDGAPLLVWGLVRDCDATED
ncbi:hypothetical protein [Microbacterium resistens]|uniref:hypothetical protein n=1 Tax=Microbacterium resistens TaxID=156977 RepID=UPI0036727B32